MRLAMKCSPWKEICTLNNAAVSEYRSQASEGGHFRNLKFLNRMRFPHN